jgi:hypothetical protein
MTMTAADVRSVELLAATPTASDAEIADALESLGLDGMPRETLAAVCREIGVKPGRTTASAAEAIRQRIRSRRLAAMVNWV